MGEDIGAVASVLLGLAALIVLLGLAALWIALPWLVYGCYRELLRIRVLYEKSLPAEPETVDVPQRPKAPKPSVYHVVGSKRGRNSTWDIKAHDEASARAKASSKGIDVVKVYTAG